jgi:hypothetical protein
MIGENQQLVTDEPVEFEKWTGWSSRLHENNQSFKRNLYKNIPQFNKGKPTEGCQHVTHRLDLQNTLGSQPIMPKNLPKHWAGSPCSLLTWRLTARNLTYWSVADNQPARIACCSHGWVGPDWLDSVLRHRNNLRFSDSKYMYSIL